ncbi:MAG: APC family permease [Gammaproteobacteria bacterium]|nr:APC family permease [Gammaproteobacteria bacterium]
MRSNLGLVTLIGLVIANMIGAGVFTTSGFALGDLGSPVLVLVAWLIGGIIAICGAISYGALSRLLPYSGGEYLFLSRNVHPLAGFIAGWISLLAGFTGAIAYAAITFAVYLLPGSSSTKLTGNIVATLAILAALVIHGFRVRHGAAIQNITVALKLLLIVFFIGSVAFGPGFAEWEGVRAYQATDSGGFSLTAFATTLMWISFSYSGFNAAIYVAGEVDNARQMVPRAILQATIITTIIYLLLNTIFVFAPDPAAVSFKEDVAVIAASVLGGESLAKVIRAIIIVALFTSLSAMVMIGPRVYAQMAEDGLMPGALKFTRDAPHGAIIMQALLAIVVVWITSLRELLSYLGFTLGISAAATVASLFVLVRRNPALAVQLPAYPWAPLVFICFTLLFAGLAAFRNPWEMLAAILTILTGILLYFILHRS